MSFSKKTGSIKQSKAKVLCIANLDGRTKPILSFTNCKVCLVSIRLLHTLSRLIYAFTIMIDLGQRTIERQVAVVSVAKRKFVSRSECYRLGFVSTWAYQNDLDSCALATILSSKR